MKIAENLIWDIQCSARDSKRSYGEPLTLIGWPQCLLVQSALTSGDIVELGISSLKITVFIFVTPCTQKRFGSMSLTVLEFVFPFVAPG
jgi:hypothetical protein